MKPLWLCSKMTVLPTTSRRHGPLYSLLFVMWGGGDGMQFMYFDTIVVHYVQIPNLVEYLKML
jgi:hypothetical protein